MMEKSIKIAPCNIVNIQVIFQTFRCVWAQLVANSAPRCTQNILLEVQYDLLYHAISDEEEM